MDEQQADFEWRLSDYVGAIRRRALSATIVFVVIVASGAVIALAWPPVYRSMATILIEQQEIPPDLVRSTITSFADQRIQLINQRVMTTTRLLEIIREHGLYAEDFDRLPREAIIDRMRAAVHMDTISANVVDPQSGQPTTATIAFTVGYDSRSPQLAANVANELTSLFLEENSQTRRQQAAEASAFLADETQRLSAEVAALEAALAEFKQANVDRLPELAALNQQFLNRAEQELADVRRQRGVIDERRVYLEAELAQLRPSGGDDPNAAMTADPAERLRMLEAYLANVSGVYTDNHPDVVRTKNAIGALRTQLGLPAPSTDAGADGLEGLKTSRDALLERYGPLHPDVVRVERQIEAAEARLRDEPPAPQRAPARPTNPAYVQLQAQLASDAVERSALVAKEAELRREIAAFEGRLLQTPAVERDYNALTRELASARLKHQEVSAKQREAVVAENLEMGDKAERFSLIEPPLVPGRPLSPNRSLIFLAAVVLALAAAGAIVVVRELADSSVKGPSEFERRFGITPLGIIPAILTAADVRLHGRRRAQAVVAAVAIALVEVALAHFFVAPIDALFAGALRRLGV
jgi:uncharacterized protein involved in exopolysaccharide biosynthesis